MTIRARILATRRLPDAVTRRLQFDYDFRANLDDHIMSADEIIAGAESCDALLVTAGDSIDAALVDALPSSIQMIATYSAGYEHIDLDACRRRGLTVANTPDVLTGATADVAMLLMLGAARRAYEGERAVRENTWQSTSLTYLLGVHLNGKRLGILGMGRIGQAVAKRARAFGMEIHYSNRRRLSSDLERGAIFYADPDAMLSQIDILSINAAGGPGTYRWLNESRIRELPDGAIVVNTSRGSVIDEEALIAALRSGKLFAAGLDVYENEPHLAPAFRQLSNVILMPHLGSATIETRNAMGFKALDNLDAFFAGKSVINRVA